MQPKAIAHPTDWRLMHRELIKLVKLARDHGIALRRSYLRLAKCAAIMVGRYLHAHQFRRARRALKFLRTRAASGDLVELAEAHEMSNGAPRAAQ